MSDTFEKTFFNFMFSDHFFILPLNTENIILDLLLVDFIVLDEIEPRFWQDEGLEELDANERVDQADHTLVHHEELSDFAENFSRRMFQKLLCGKFAALC